MLALRRDRHPAPWVLVTFAWPRLDRHRGAAFKCPAKAT
jgi:hypothetical protein